MKSTLSLSSFRWVCICLLIEQPLMPSNFIHFISKSNIINLSEVTKHVMNSFFEYSLLSMICLNANIWSMTDNLIYFNSFIHIWTAIFLTESRTQLKQRHSSVIAWFHYTPFITKRPSFIWHVPVSQKNRTSKCNWPSQVSPPCSSKVLERRIKILKLHYYTTKPKQKK